MHLDLLSRAYQLAMIEKRGEPLPADTTAP